MEDERHARLSQWQATEAATARRIKAGWLRLDLIIDAVRGGWQGRVPDPRKAVEDAIVAAAKAGEIPLYLDDDCTVRVALPVEDALSHVAKIREVQRWFALNSRWPLGALAYPSLMGAEWPAYPVPKEPRLIAGRRLWRLSDAVDAIAAMPDFGVKREKLVDMAGSAARGGELTVREPEGGERRNGDQLSEFLVEWVYAKDFNTWLEGAEFQEPYRLQDEIEPVTASADPVHAAMDPATAGTSKVWTDERLEQLRAYRETHGTKKAAKHFRISTSRVRALLPGNKPAPKGYSAFNLGQC